MAVAVIMPRQGNTVESCIITKWAKQKGDAVKVGDILFSYETDKAAFDEEAEVEGTLAGRLFPGRGRRSLPDERLRHRRAGREHGRVQAQPRGAAAADAPKEEAPAQAAAPEAAAPAEELAEPVVISGRSEDLAARQGAGRAHRRGSLLRPSTGPDGRVIERDVQALLDAGRVVSAAARGAYAGGVEGTGLGGPRDAFRPRRQACCRRRTRRACRPGGRRGSRRAQRRQLHRAAAQHPQGHRPHHALLAGQHGAADPQHHLRLHPDPGPAQALQGEGRGDGHEQGLAQRHRHVRRGAHADDARAPRPQRQPHSTMARR